MPKFSLTQILKYIALVGFVFFISCNNQDESKKYKIGFSQTGINDDWRKSMNEAMKIQVGFY